MTITKEIKGTENSNIQSIEFTDEYIDMCDITVGDSGPILKYYDLRKCKIIARQQLQKHKLKDKYSEYYDDSLTANEILAKVKIIPLYNSGNFRFEKEI